MKSRNPVRARVVARLNPVAGAVAVAMGGMIAAPQPLQAADGIFEDIVVTATRRAAGVQDIPYNISAFSGDDIDRERITNVADLARRIPGVQLVDQGQRNPSPLIMRGISVDSLAASEALGNNNGGTVAIYVGEIPVYIDLVPRDIERIEVLRGPQGTLFGADSLAGALRYIPRAPDTSEFTAEVHGRGYGIKAGDGVSYDIDGTVNIPITESLAFRGTLAYMDQKGFIDQNYVVLNPGTSIPEPDFTNTAEVNANLRQEKDVNTLEKLYARAALRWEISDALESTLTYYYQNQDSGGRQVNHRDSLQVIAADQGVNIPTGFYDNGHRVLEPDERTNHIVNLDVIADLGFAELTSATGYVDFDEKSQRDQTDLLLTFGYTYADFPSFTAFTTDPLNEETFTQEFRLVSTSDGPLNWLAGFFYRDQTSDQLSLEFVPQLYDFAGVAEIPQVIARYSGFRNGRDIEYIQDETEELKEWALYGEISYQFTDAWQVTGGLRYFEQENDVRRGIGFPLFNQALAIDPNDPAEQIWYNESTASAKIDDVIFKFNTSYNFTDDVMGYFTISEGFRSGGSNSIGNCDDIPVPNPNVVCGTAAELAYDPDTTVNYELGLRSVWLEGSLVLNAAVFYIDWDKVQVATTSTGGGFPITINGDSAESTGLELEINWQITDSLRARGGYSYTTAELSADAPLLGEGTARKGDRLPGTPEHQGSLFFDYNRSLNAELDLIASYGFTTQSDVFTQLGSGSSCCRPDPVDPAGRPGAGEKLGGYTVHYASVGLAGDRWEATLYADNLFDKQAVTGVRTDESYIGRAGFTADYALRRYFNYVLTPRIVGLDLRYRF